MKNYFVVCLALLLVIQTVVSPLQLVAYAEEDTSIQEVAENVFNEQEAVTIATVDTKVSFDATLTDLQIKINNVDVTKVPQPIAQNSTVQMDFKFAAMLIAPKVGDYFEFDLPESLVDWDKQFNGDSPLFGNNPGFKWETINNKLRLTFTDIDQVKHSGKAEFQVSLVSGFDLSEAGESLEQDLVVPSVNGGVETFKLTFLPSSSNKKLINKTPVNKVANIVDGERYFEWKVWLNEAGKDLTGAVIKDTTSEGHSIDGPITVKTYKVGLNGVSTTVESTKTYNSMEAIKLDGTDAYEITYRTTVQLTEDKQEGTVEFQNTIGVYNGPTKLDESNPGKVTTTYGKALNKSIHSASNYESTWYIDYNFNQRAINQSEAYVVDTLTGSHKVDYASFNVYEAVIDEKGNFVRNGALVTNYNVVADPKNPNNFTLQFNDRITKAYRIVYKAKFDENFYTASSETLSNVVSNGPKTLSPVTTTIGQKILSKSYKYDLENQTITWTVRVNADNEGITNLTLTDSFKAKNGTKGTHELVSDVKVNGVVKEHQLINNDPKQGFVLTNINIPKGSSATIVYTTSYAVGEDGALEPNPNYRNDAAINFNGGDRMYDLATFSEFAPGTTSINNGRKWGDFNYLTQELSWNVVINANKRDMSSAVVVDKLGAGHKIIDDSFVVKYYTRGATDLDGTPGAVVDPSIYKIDVADDKTSYTVTFKDNLNDAENKKAFIITYKTKDADNILGIDAADQANKGNVYTNDATLTTKNNTQFNLETAKVTLNESVANSLIKKTVTKNEGSNNNGILTWYVDVNRSHSDLKNVVFSDVPSERIVLNKKSIQIMPYTVTATKIEANGIFKSPKEYGFDLTFTEDGGFEINFGDLKNKGYQVKYETMTLISSSDDGSLSNAAKLTFDNDDVLANNQKSDAGVRTKFNFSRSLAGFSLTKADLVLEKVGQNIVTGEQTPVAGAKFELYLSGTDVLVRDDIISDEAGLIKIDNLNYGHYQLREISAPFGYELRNYDITFDEAYTKKATPTQLINRRADVTVTKKWVNGDPQKRENITIQLLQNGKVFKTTTLTPDQSSYTWSNLPVVKDGKEAVYTVDEVTVSNYSKSINGLTITNTFFPNLKAITAEKKWVNGPSARPTIELQLNRILEGSTVAEKVGAPVTLTSGNVKHTWTNLPETNEKQVAYRYFVNEVAVPTNYKDSISEDGLTITNTYVIPKTSFTATKLWENGPADKPQIKFQLLRDGVEFGEAVVVENNTHTWTNLDKTDIDGIEYRYTVKEINPPKNYISSVSTDGKTVTNSYVIPKDDITATKVWENGPATKPTIQLQLFRTLQGSTEKEAVREPITLKSGETKATWKALEMTNISGIPYTYTVDEVEKPKNYAKTLNGLTVTNSYVIPKTSVKVEKEWVDGPDQYPTIQIQLYRTLEGSTDKVAHLAPITLENNKTDYTWENLDETNIDGIPYTYSVEEVEVPKNYVTHVDGFNITNTYVIPKTSVTMEKQWINGPATHPTIEVQLYRVLEGSSEEAESVGEAITLVNGETTYTWENLDETDINGVVYNYSVKELVTPPNYKQSIDGFTITNEYVIPKTLVTAEKQWVNGPAKHPSIKLQLFKDGIAYLAPVELHDGETAYTWENLDATDINGNEHVYTVDEVEVPVNYSKVVEGWNITNTYVIPLEDVTVTKVWENKPNKIPTIQIQLYRDGIAIFEPITLKDGETTYTWEDLPVTDEFGHFYTYTVKEITELKHYVVSIDGLTITNTYIAPVQVPSYNVLTTVVENVKTIEELEKFFEEYNALTDAEREELGQFEEIERLRLLLEKLKAEAAIQDEQKLPQTDGEFSYLPTFIGMLFIMLSVFFLRRRAI